MKQRKVRHSKNPPMGWPDEKEWKKIEKELKKQLPTVIISDSAHPVERLKQEICSQFIRYFNKSDISQRELARKLEVPESRVSEILHYHHSRFTIDKLIELLAKIKPQVRVKVA